jgi:hypothetical protein
MQRTQVASYDVSEQLIGPVFKGLAVPDCFRGFPQRSVTKITRYVIRQKGENLTYTSAEAWNHATFLVIFP